MSNFSTGIFLKEHYVLVKLYYKGEEVMNQIIYDKDLVDVNIRKFILQLERDYKLNSLGI